MRPSKQLLATLEYATKAEGWLSSDELANAKGMSGSTARTHLKKLTEAGLINAKGMSPAYLYQMAPDWEKKELAQFLN